MATVLPSSYLVHLLDGLIPPSVIKFFETHLLDPASPFGTAISKFYTFLSNFIAYQLWPALEPTMDKLAMYLHNSPQIVSVAVLLGVIFIVVQILSFVNRVIRFWARIVMRLVFWGVIGVLVSMAWQRGLEQCVRDVIAVYGWVEVWMREYEAAQRDGAARGQQPTGYGSYKGGY